MAGMTSSQLAPPTFVVLPPVLGAATGRSRIAGPAPRPTGH